MCFVPYRAQAYEPHSSQVRCAGKPHGHLSLFQSLKVWATALSLAWLDKHFSQARTEYEMIHVKGTKWVTSQELHGTGLEQLLKDATKQV